jgi:hypothetical protein
MANLKTGVTVSAVLLSVAAASSASAAGVAPAAVERAQVPADALMRTYATPQEAIAALRAAGRQDLLRGTVQDFTGTGNNPSDTVATSDWYALFGSECCLVVLDKAADAAIVAGDTPLADALARGEGVALMRREFAAG